MGENHTSWRLHVLRISFLRQKRKCYQRIKQETASGKIGGFFVSFFILLVTNSRIIISLHSWIRGYFFRSNFQLFVTIFYFLKKKIKGFTLLSGLGTRFHKKIIYLYFIWAKKNELHADIKQTIRIELITNFVAPSPNIIKFLKSKDSKADTKTLNK